MTIIKELMNNSIVKSVMKVASGTAIAQVLGLLLIPLITRIYGAEAYGVQGIYISTLALLTSIVALTLPRAIVLPKNREEAQAITRLSFKIIIIITFLSLLILIFTKDEVMRILDIESIGSWIFLIPIAAFFAGILEIVQQWTIREKEFGVFAKAAVYQSLFNNGGKVLLGWIAPIVANLIIISSLIDLFRASIIIKFFKKRTVLKFGFLKKSEWKDQELLKKYKDFPLFQAPEVFIYAISQGIPIIILTSFFGPVSAGFYALGRMVLSTPSSLLGNAITDVYYPRLAQAEKNNEPIKPILLKATKVLLLIGALPYGILFLFSPILFEIIFGEEWRIAGEYSRWLVLWIYVMFVNGPCIKTLIIIKEQKWNLKFSIITLILRLVILFLGSAFFHSAIIAIILYSLLGCTVNISLILQTLLKAQNFDENRSIPVRNIFGDLK